MIIIITVERRRANNRLFAEKEAITELKRSPRPVNTTSPMTIPAKAQGRATITDAFVPSTPISIISLIDSRVSFLTWQRRMSTTVEASAEYISERPMAIRETSTTIGSIRCR